MLLAVVGAALVLSCASFSAAPTASPEVELPLGQPDAQLKASVLESLATAAAASPPPTWYRYLHMLGDLPDVAVEGGVLYVIAELPDTEAGRESAHSVCVGIAGLLAREGVVVADVSHLAVSNRSNVTLADCLPIAAGEGPAS